MPEAQTIQQYIQQQFDMLTRCGFSVVEAHTMVNKSLAELTHHIAYGPPVPPGKQRSERE